MLITSSQVTNHNHLLAALKADEFDRLKPHLELIQMRLGNALYESGDRLQYVWFPTTAIVSMQCIMEDGASSEIAGVGNEGVLGVSLFIGGAVTPNRAIVQTGGYGYRIKAGLVLQEFNRIESFHRLVLLYIQALIAQISMTAACNRHHTIEQQLCRWLLLTIDRLTSTDLIMTQELIASMLGVRREGITEAAGNLKKADFINYRRGHIAVLDRHGLETLTCECYQVVKKEFNCLLTTYATTRDSSSQAFRKK
ncbi:Crp/Fnr family transcriptional regulator [Candidatus Nitrotoga sp. M5]|uniref:Crp/Fnr family transcriptional regulator n=1 Tax=Candidatus Nitrotoga sp. M5 TaxID=2890409 RepID=UPI001EF28FC9|nr:Crp/Fnr family transcriptional regulator [Candidatus Nitrotoga sp. M5]CAH1385604.1 cAMP-binding proteins - catabolite gene activator and regulatory subunit of cAMP-dependent protein kinases [Candidatus Nitrotoga sp. M5]